MIINSITLKNFRSYEDETTFCFTPKFGKNIVLIGGENGSGKSTLFEAIKLCMYGPTIYGYLGQNYNYLARIKDLINDNAFKNQEVASFIHLNLAFKEGTELKCYTLKRSWTYEEQKIIEKFTVLSDGIELNNEDMLYFDNYLKSAIPPSLFDFFFFDGESLSDFFTGKNASANLKDSILQLFNYDSFDVLKKHLITHQRIQSKSNEKLATAQKRYNELYIATNNNRVEIGNLEKTLLSSKENLDNLLICRKKKEDDFKNSGGLLEEEQYALNLEISRLENERSEINQSIKDFCNDTLPFLLVTNLLKDTKEQIEKEEELNAYKSIKKKLLGDIVKKSLSIHHLDSTNLDDFYDKLAATLLSNMFDEKMLGNISSILELSLEEKNSINFMIDNILAKNKPEVFNRFKRISDISHKLKILREKLNSTISTDILNRYLGELHYINEEITTTQNAIAVARSTIERMHEDLKNNEYHLIRAKNEYTALLQNSNVFDISSNLISYLNELLINLTGSKIELIQEEFIKIFCKILRKENYVNSIVIDDNFNFTLYINKEYFIADVVNIIKHLGFEATTKKYGPKFLEDLIKHYNVKNNVQLETKMINDLTFDSIILSTKVNINDFSNGEKQIFILCLIWAIIKSSGVEIPFIIDTPYARIDETHRNALTNTYLPSISDQVILLSTNKEIDEELYKIINPYICDEYLLLYNDKSRKTEIKKGYFEV